MEKSEAIELLKQALDDIPNLRELQYDNREFELWRDRVRNILKATLMEDDVQRFASRRPIKIRGVFSNDVYQGEYLERVADYETALKSIIEKYEMLGFKSKSITKSDLSGSEPPRDLVVETNWKAIEREFGVTKMSFGKRTNFIIDRFKRKIIFRDVEQAFVLASLGFSKPAVILAGSVIEELLRLYLEYKNISPLSDNFDGYIRTCEQNGLLKDSVSRLSHAVRQFRNLVHLSAETTKKHTISKATAIGAVSSIFTIANDF